MRSLPMVFLVTDIYGLKFCVQFLSEIFRLLGCYSVCIVR